MGTITERVCEWANDTWDEGYDDYNYSTENVVKNKIKGFCKMTASAGMLSWVDQSLIMWTFFAICGIVLGIRKKFKK